MKMTFLSFFSFKKKLKVIFDFLKMKMIIKWMNELPNGTLIIMYNGILSFLRKWKNHNFINHTSCKTNLAEEKKNLIAIMNRIRLVCIFSFR